MLGDRDSKFLIEACNEGVFLLFLKREDNCTTKMSKNKFATFLMECVLFHKMRICNHNEEIEF